MRIPVINRPSLGVEAIEVEAGKQSYHLICISSSSGALRVFSTMQEKYGKLTTDELTGKFNEAFGKGVWGFV